MEDASETKQSLKTGAFSISPQTGSDRVKQQQKNPNKHNNTPLKHLPDSKIPKKKKNPEKAGHNNMNEKIGHLLH